MIIMENKDKTTIQLLNVFTEEYMLDNKKNIKEKDLKKIRANLINGVYKAFVEIRMILENDELDDFQCVEAIVRVYENLGLDCGGRHDFG